MSLNSYGNHLECRGCGAGPDEQTWIDTFPESAFRGLCTACALVKRGLKRKIDMSRLTLEIVNEMLLEKTGAEMMLARLTLMAVTTPELRAAFAAALVDVQMRWKRLDAREKFLMK